MKEAVSKKWCIATENKLLFKNLPSRHEHHGGWLGEAEISSYQVMSVAESEDDPTR
ncbi:hypothetical protein [Alteromonas sp. ASW11-130]|uniref:hypothetical protein n=1 Tax=Alteromonas sp. ASW11-130 TaxID=3015775 RepID=UPI002241A3B9|nr:hypothetical protein [Alteromonas sp. ASW11-130]MCW8093402.1 hypothetical protein [Alteromonas sp. ASW11-130]